MHRRRMFWAPVERSAWESVSEPNCENVTYLLDWPSNTHNTSLPRLSCVRGLQQSLLFASQYADSGRCKVGIDRSVLVYESCLKRPSLKLTTLFSTSGGTPAARYTSGRLRKMLSFHLEMSADSRWTAKLACRPACNSVTRGLWATMAFELFHVRGCQNFAQKGLCRSLVYWSDNNALFIHLWIRELM